MLVNENFGIGMSFGTVQEEKHQNRTALPKKRRQKNTQNKGQKDDDYRKNGGRGQGSNRETSYKKQSVGLTSEHPKQQSPFPM